MEETFWKREGLENELYAAVSKGRSISKRGDGLNQNCMCVLLNVSAAVLANEGVPFFEIFNTTRDGQSIDKKNHETRIGT